MMASQWVAFVTMAIVFIAGSCKPNKGDYLQWEGLSENRPDVYDRYQALIDERMQKINKSMPHNNVLFDEATPSENKAHNCVTVTKMMKPFVYNGKNTMLVVQSRFFEQKFSVTSCKEPKAESKAQNNTGVKCFDSMNLRFTGTCRTRQTTIKLYVFDIEKKEVQRVPVNIDVCCTCALS